ncbi:MAG: FliM/FliN family flagellar motor switch protein [Acidocella sp.]|nr:FliM/FliN family flagellar motor switch protein [Acidocella sp.]
MLDDITDAEPLDLLDSMRAPQLRSLLMETLSDRFMRQIAFALFQRTRSSVQLLSCINGVMSHESAMSSLPDVMLAGVAELAPLRGRMLLVVDGDLIGAVVDAICGATAPHPFERYELSVMETRIAKQMIDLSLTTLAESLSSLVHLSLKPIAYESATGMLAIADGQDWMIVVTGIFDSALGSGTIKIIAPYAGFEPLEVKVAGQSGLLGQHGTDAGWITAIESLTETTPVTLSFDLVRASVPLAVFDALAPGMVLPFCLGSEVIAVAGGVDLFRADYGQTDGQICCRVIARDPPAPDQHKISGDDAMSDQKTDQRADDKLNQRPDQTDQTQSSNSGRAAERVELERLQALPRGHLALSARHLLDRVQVGLTVELGRTQITVKDLRQLRHGQIVVLEQMVGEPLTIFANGQKLAFGEVVAVTNDRYGIRVTALADDALADNEDAA